MSLFLQIFRKIFLQKKLMEDSKLTDPRLLGDADRYWTVILPELRYRDSGEAEYHSGVDSAELSDESGQDLAQRAPAHLFFALGMMRDPVRGSSRERGLLILGRGRRLYLRLDEGGHLDEAHLFSVQVRRVSAEKELFFLQFFLQFLLFIII